jgi:hypothetical protein
MSDKPIYIPHDLNAQSDPKIIAVRLAHGMRGYGLWWATVELLGQSRGHSLPEKAAETLAMFAAEDVEYVRGFIETCIRAKLLQADPERGLMCATLDKRLQVVDEKRFKARQAAEARWGRSVPASDEKKELPTLAAQQKKEPPAPVSRESVDNSQRQHADAYADAHANAYAGKERKGSKGKEEDGAQGASASKARPASEDEVAQFLMSEGLTAQQASVLGQKFWLYYESNGWKVGRNAMKNWKMAARRWKLETKVDGGAQNTQKPQMSSPAYHGKL